MTKRVLVVAGTRPEGIKLAPVIAELRRRPHAFETVVCTSAQHRDMLDQVWRLFGVTPDHDLDVMSADQDLFDVTVQILHGLKAVLGSVKPDLVMVQGDTATAFAASVAAYYGGVPVAHVEAGLRSGNKRQPFPEEMYRRATTVVADHHFAPTERARAALIAEGVPDDTIRVTGNTVVDALIAVNAMLCESGAGGDVRRRLEESFGLHLDARPMVLVTAHRRESFGGGIERICGALLAIARRRPDVTLVFPVHPNPNVYAPVRAHLGAVSNIRLIEPLAYDELVFLLSQSHLVLTDSGGIQEEAPSLDKPVLVLRDVTERLEGVEAGVAALVGTNEEAIVSRTLELLDDEEAYARMARAPNPYGDGHASERIADALEPD